MTTRHTFCCRHMGLRTLLVSLCNPLCFTMKSVFFNKSILLIVLKCIRLTARRGSALQPWLISTVSCRNTLRYQYSDCDEPVGGGNGREGEGADRGAHMQRVRGREQVTEQGSVSVCMREEGRERERERERNGTDDRRQAATTL